MKESNLKRPFGTLVRAATHWRGRRNRRAVLIRFDRVVAFVEKLNDYEKAFCLVCSFLILGLFDVLTGFRDVTEHLYYLPVWLAAWFFNRRAMRAMAYLVTARIALEPLFHPTTFDAMFVLSVLAHSFMYFFSGSLIAALRDVYDREHEQARIDALTSIRNTHGFYEAAGEHLDQVREDFKSFAYVYIDLDQFKQLNDTRGHLEADRALRAVGQVLRQATRSTDIVGRLGGDEFVAVLPNTGPDMAFAVAERLRKRIDGELKRRGWAVTASVGCVAFTETPDSVRDALTAADELMYQAKGQGKSQLTCKVWGLDGVKVDRAIVALPPLLSKTSIR